MKGIRFYMADMGLILETPIALTPRQRHAVSLNALRQYEDRYRLETNKFKKERLIEVMTLIRMGKFIERPIPKYDCDKEIEIYG